MSRLLLDTQALLWFLLNDPSLSVAARSAIADPANDLQVSPASYWEIAIKISTGKYCLPMPFDAFFSQQLAINRIGILPIDIRHASVLTTLPFHHRDPFDRLIIAQAMAEGVDVVSADRAFDAYPVRRIW